MGDDKYNTNTIRYIGSEIERMADDLGLSDRVLKDTFELYQSALDAGFDFAKLDDVSTAFVYIVAQSRNEATFNQVAEVARIDRNRLHTVATRLVKNLPIEPPVPKTDPLVEQACEDLGIEAYADEIRGIIEDVYPGNHPGSAADFPEELLNKAPSSVVAGAIYAGTFVYDYDKKQADIAEVLPVTRVTIRNVYPLVKKHMQVEVDRAHRQFDSVDEAFDTLVAELSLSDDVVELADARLTIDRAADRTKASEAGLVLGAICATMRQHAPESEAADPATLSGYARVTEQTIEKHARRMCDE